MGDFGFLLGILVLWYAVGSVAFSELNAAGDFFQPYGGYLAVGLILVFCGTVGKSAQLPLHVWLPNSMEGPTPVSSLLHAATMVAAGVYMLARIFPLLVFSETALLVIGWIGGITCFVAGLMGLQQDDIKRILAYSTISQLGYMVMGIAVAPSAEVSMFHLFTHAFFKCLLFLCAGSVIMGMHHEQNIWKMGALKNKMPVTFFCTLFGALALVGFPGFSGYFSKDTIIAWALENNTPLFWISAAAVALTAAYTFRLFFVVFLGAPRSDAAKNAHESPGVMILPMSLLALAALGSGWPFIAKFFFDVPHPHDTPMMLHIVILGFLAIGLITAFLLYARGPEKDPVRIPAFANRLYIDDVYNWLVRCIQGGFASFCAFVDRWIIDALGVQLPAKVLWFGGFVLRFLQFGNLQAYAFYFAAGVVVLLYIILSK
ncbi:MAG: NADH-quinone oxidoreductase subunit L [Chthoniobacterales bacterium]